MKRGYLGIFESGYLAGRSIGHKETIQKLGITVPENSISLDKMIYLAAFQGGMQKIVTHILFRDSGQPISEFITKKSIKPKNMDVDLINGLKPLFDYAKSEDPDNNSIMVISFIHDLIAGMQNNASIINASGIPNISEVKKIFPAEISSPICNIISQLAATDELLPAPSLVIPRENIDRFREILESNIYSQYSSAHKELELSNSASEKVLADIKHKGSELLKTGEGLLSQRRVSMNIIPMLPKVVDAAFGQLPGALAQIAGDMAAKYLDNGRNVIIYQFNDWANEYARDQTLRILNNNARKQKD